MGNHMTSFIRAPARAFENKNTDESFLLEEQMNVVVSC